jgi:hypothetical protein
MIETRIPGPGRPGATFRQADRRKPWHTNNIEAVEAQGPWHASCTEWWPRGLRLFSLPPLANREETKTSRLPSRRGRLDVREPIETLRPVGRRHVATAELGGFG